MGQNSISHSTFFFFFFPLPVDTWENVSCYPPKISLANLLADSSSWPCVLLYKALAEVYVFTQTTLQAKGGCGWEKV